MSTSSDKPSQSHCPAISPNNGVVDRVRSFEGIYHLGASTSSYGCSINFDGAILRSKGIFVELNAVHVMNPN